MQGIRGLSAERNAADPTQAPLQLDSCYAFSSEREVIARYWPLHFRAQEEACADPVPAPAGASGR